MWDELFMLAGSLTGVGLVVLLVWWLSPDKSRMKSEKEAAAAAEALAAAFIAGPVLLDKHGRSALVADVRGDGFVILKQAGEHPCGRYLAKPQWHTDGSDNLVIDSEDRWFGTVPIAPASTEAATRFRNLLEQAA